jgi:hypothetical protein
LSQNTELALSPIGGAARVGIDSCPVPTSVFRHKAAIVIAAAALCATVAGCSDLPASKMQKPEAGGQMRYYGGPKSPMWSG